MSLLLLLFLQLAQAADFKSTYLAFEMPENFICEKNIGTYVCFNSTGPKMKDEIIVVSFKKSGPQDTLEQYRTQMRQPRSIRDKNKLSILSQVFSSNDINANGLPWVESRHLNSEIENYYSSYWVTKAGGVAMLISYSAELTKKVEWTRQSEIIRSTLSVDGSAVTAVEDQAQIAAAADGGDSSITQQLGSTPDIMQNTQGQSAAAAQAANAGTINLGGVSVKKSHLIIAVAALVAILLLGAAIKR